VTHRCLVTLFLHLILSSVVNTGAHRHSHVPLWSQLITSVGGSIRGLCQKISGFLEFYSSERIWDTGTFGGLRQFGLVHCLSGGAEF
jgi:hypothetical protein